MTTMVTITDTLLVPDLQTPIYARVTFTPNTEQGRLVLPEGTTFGSVSADTSQVTGAFSLAVPVVAGVLWSISVAPLGSNGRVSPGARKFYLGTFAVTAQTTKLSNFVDTEILAMTASFRQGILDAATQVAADRAAVEALGNTNDTIIASRINDTASATHGALTATFGRKVSLVVDAAGGGDYTTIAAALAAVPAGGADVLVKRGTYTLTANFNVPGKTTLRGEGADATIIRLGNGVNTNIINVLAGADDVTIRDLTVDGNRANQTSNSNCIYTVAARTTVLNCHVKDANGYNIVGFPGATDFRVQGCTSEGARDEGIEFHGVVRGSAVGNLVRNIGKNGIYVYANTTSNAANVCKDITISGNVVEGSSALTAGYAHIRVDDRAEGVTVTGNTVSGGGTDCKGIVVSSSIPAYPTRSVSVVGNTVRNVLSTGIEVGTAIGTSVQGNTVYGALQGVAVLINAKGTVVTGNVLESCQRSGILLIDSTDFTVTGNICRNNGLDQAQTNHYHGITLWSSSGTVNKGSVIGNRCYDDQGTKTQQHGIRTLNTIGASVVIAHNILDGNATAGLTYSFGGATAASTPAWKKLTGITVTSGGNSIPHGLPYVPQSIVVCMTSAGTVWKSGGSDATNIVLMSDSGSRTCDVYVG